MIRVFNANNPSLLLFLFLYIIVINLSLFITPEYFPLPDSNAPLTELFYFLTGLLGNNNYYFLAILSMLILFIQALLLNQLINEVKMHDKGNYIPALIFVTVACMSKDFLFMSPALLANTFIILTLRKAFLFYRKQYCFAEIYDTGLLIGISSLFYFPTLILSIMLFIALAIFRAFSWREWLIGASGLLTVYFLAGTYFFLIDQLPQYINDYFREGFISLNVSGQFPVSFWIVLGFVVLMVFGSLYAFQENYLKSPIHLRKFLTLIGGTLVLLSLSFLLKPHLTLNHFVILSVPLSVVIAYFFLNINKLWRADLVHLLFFIIIMLFQYLVI